ncbi:hypothetical protein [Endozoicomonas elysicola]|uniref:Uncharacterized protein n=1 Tax=Endozoicomonas elysicola TaxID=305900 RepID=A0A081K889_9GAMM|nr:hypothetical protein [Endozoicomonas elysicola]KEI70365.1 hypothetical protein GV64_06155 [Endozoicomonas elysicola]
MQGNYRLEGSEGSQFNKLPRGSTASYSSQVAECVGATGQYLGYQISSYNGRENSIMSPRSHYPSIRRLARVSEALQTLRDPWRELQRGAATDKESLKARLSRGEIGIGELKSFVDNLDRLDEKGRGFFKSGDLVDPDTIQFCLAIREQALQIFEEHLEKFPKSKKAENGKLFLLKRLGEDRKLLDYCDQLLCNGRRVEHIEFKRVEALTALGDFERAYGHLEDIKKFFRGRVQADISDIQIDMAKKEWGIAKQKLYELKKNIDPRDQRYLPVIDWMIFCSDNPERYNIDPVYLRNLSLAQSSRIESVASLSGDTDNGLNSFYSRELDSTPEGLGNDFLREPHAEPVEMTAEAGAAYCLAHHENQIDLLNNEVNRPDQPTSETHLPDSETYSHASGDIDNSKSSDFNMIMEDVYNFVDFSLGEDEPDLLIKYQLSDYECQQLSHALDCFNDKNYGYALLAIYRIKDNHLNQENTEVDMLFRSCIKEIWG